MKDIARMETGTWRDRLAAAIEASGKSMREISLGAGRGAGYVHSILKDGKDPTVDHLILVCEQANVSLSYIMYGIDISKEAEEILHELAAANPDQRRAMLVLLKNANRG
jgi:transcriptional regulator with XRE-family HTH domain